MARGWTERWSGRIEDVENRVDELEGAIRKIAKAELASINTRLKIIRKELLHIERKKQQPVRRRKPIR